MLMLMIEAIEDNDDRAFMLDLYENYYRLVRKTVYSFMPNDNDIEDLVTDVFIKLIEKVSTLRKLSSCKITSYVVYTSKSVTLNYLKHMNVVKKHTFYGTDADIADDIIGTDENMEDRLFRQSEVEALGNAILNLPQKQQDLLHFKYELEMSDAEIAAILGINQNSVREYLTRARRNAKRQTEKELLSNGK